MTDTNLIQPTKFLTQKEVAIILNMTVETLNKKIKAGDVPAIKIGKTIRIPENFLEIMAAQKDRDQE